MRLAENGQPVYRYNELVETAKNVAKAEIEFELFVDAVNHLSMEKYCTPQKENLEKKGFIDISFYRFFIDEEKVKIDFTFLYIINKETFETFNTFAKAINFKYPIIIADFIKSENLIVEVLSKKYIYNDYENRKSNISVEAAYDKSNISIKNFVSELTKTFESYYEYILDKTYKKINRDIDKMTTQDALLNFLKDFEFYSNGMIY